MRATSDDEPAAGTPIGRRRAVATIGAALAAALGAGSGTALLASCRTAPATGSASRPTASGGPAGPGRLTARPGASRDADASSGLFPLGLAAGGRDGRLYVPTGYRADTPAPLVLMLHGAGGSAEGALRPFLDRADERGLLLLAPESRGATWDFIRGTYGPDVAFIDSALAAVFRRRAVDPARVAIEGFSDGASYALSLGLTNGDLFGRIVAFSPCVVAPAANVGRPRIFLSHGTRDTILPIESCGRPIAARLSGEGYDVRYREFDGPHAVPPEVALEALDWLAAR